MLQTPEPTSGEEHKTRPNRQARTDVTNIVVRLYWTKEVVKGP